LTFDRLQLLQLFAHLSKNLVLGLQSLRHLLLLALRLRQKSFCRRQILFYGVDLTREPFVFFLSQVQLFNLGVQFLFQLLNLRQARLRNLIGLLCMLLLQLLHLLLQIFELLFAFEAGRCHLSLPL